MAWLAKTIVLRCGGIRLYREWMLFFLGLMLGDFLPPRCGSKREKSPSRAIWPSIS